MSNKNKFYIVYACLILFFICRANPKLFSKELLSEEILNRSLIWRTILFSAASNKQSANHSENILNYRQSMQREAVFNIKSLNFELDPEWTSQQINFGIHGASKSSVVADDRQVYVGSDTSWFYCFSTTGKLIWKFYLGDAGRGIHSTASVDDFSVFIGSYRGTLYSIDKFTGRLNWMRILGDTIGASPILDQDSITVAVETVQPNGYLVKLDKKTGEIIWKSQNLGEQAHSSPSLDRQNKILVLGVNNSTIQAFSFLDGKNLWVQKVRGMVKSTILIHDEIGYVSTWGSELISFRVQDGFIEWRSAIGKKSQVSPVYLENEKIVFVADKSGQMFSFDALTGVPKWTIRSNMSSQLSSPIVVTSGGKSLILYYCLTHEICLIDGLGKIIKTWPTHNSFTGSPFISDQKLFLSFDEGSVESFKIK